MLEIMKKLLEVYDMILLMVALSVLIKIYKYNCIKGKRTFKNFFLTVWKDLLSDLIIILTLLIINNYVIEIHPGIMLIGICLSDSILNWFINNQIKLTSKIMKKIFTIIINEFKLLDSKDIDEDDEIHSK